MEHRIAKKKLILFHHLTNPPMHSLAAEVASEQATLSYPGLVMECTNLITNYNLPDFKKLSKKQWKNIVNKKIKEKNMFSLMEKIKSYKKLDFYLLADEKFEIKDYLKSLNLPDARLRFEIRTKMTKTVQMNYKGAPLY